MIAPVLPPFLDLGGTAVFALSGALLAARLNQTFVTCAFFALLTGVGGGSVRDALLGVPAFWLRDFYVAPVILVTALIAWPLFGETLTIKSVIGMGLVVLGILLVKHDPSGTDRNEAESA